MQRFGGALHLNVHFHSLVLDGVYEVLPDAAGVRFANLPAPDLPEVARVLADAVERTLPARRGARYSAVSACTPVCSYARATASDSNASAATSADPHWHPNVSSNSQTAGFSIG